MPQLGTAAMANRPVLADGAVGVRHLLLGGERLTRLPPGDLRPAVRLDVPEFPARLDKEVARIHVAVVFHHRVAVAAVVHRAAAGLVPGDRLGDVVEEPDPDAAPLWPPLFEQL